MFMGPYATFLNRAPPTLNIKFSKTYEVVTCSFGAGASPLRVALRTGVWLWNWCVGLNVGELYCT